VLADKALERVTARDSALSGRAAATAAMKAKTKIGMGMKPKKKKMMRKKMMKKRVQQRIEAVHYRFCQCWARSDP